MKRPKRPSHLDLMSFKSLCRADKTLITRRAERRGTEKEKGMKERKKESELNRRRPGRRNKGNKKY